MINGTVKYWIVSKGWGFIEGDDGEDYFVHASKIRSGQTIGKDSRVKFDISQGQRGPEAENVTLS
tara:strand:+ start:295 stop:489 length:195 start_codon:yes stop_codon:yes gene_type:complete